MESTATISEPLEYPHYDTSYAVVSVDGWAIYSHNIAACIHFSPKYKLEVDTFRV